MQILQELYRENYNEESANIVGLYIDNQWQYQKEVMSISPSRTKFTNAVIVGNGITSRQFDLTLLMPYREVTPWGEVSGWKNKRQHKNFHTYGCNALYREFNPDFLVATGDAIVNEIANNDYCNDNVVYTNSKYLEQYPNKFSFIPQNPEFNAGTIAAYLAAFDEHKKVFLLGFDGIDSHTDNYNIYSGTNGYLDNSSGVSENFWVKGLGLVMKTYPDTEFIRVGPTEFFRQPEEWKYYLNYRQINFRQFVIEIDL
jgi:hypothetical protein